MLERRTPMLHRTTQLTVGMVALLAFSSIALAQRKADPPKRGDDETVAQLVIQFRSAYREAGRPRIAVLTVLAADAGGSSANARRLQHASELDSRIKRHLIAQGQAAIVPLSPALYRIGDSGEEFTRRYWFDRWGRVKLIQTARNQDRSVLEGLSLHDPSDAARVLAEKRDADVVILIRMIETSRFSPWYSGSYEMIDLRRGLLLGSHSWKFRPVIDSDGPWTEQYGGALASRIMRDFVAASHNDGQAQELTLRILGMFETDDRGGIRDLLASIRGMQAGSVHLRKETSSGERTRLEFVASYSGGLIVLGDQVVAGLSKLFAGPVMIRSARDGVIEIGVGDLGSAEGDAAPDYGFMKKTVPRIFAGPDHAGSTDLNWKQSGTGFVVSSTGIVLTNRHVILDEDKSVFGRIDVVFPDGTILRANVVHVSKRLDLAVLSVDQTFVDYLRFADPTGPGQTAFAFGYPGVADELAASVGGRLLDPIDTPVLAVTRGTISAIRDVGGPIGTLIQTDTPINTGNSGGPLTNVQGEVLGIVTLRHKNADSVNGAIHWSAVRDDLVSAGISGIIWPD